MLRIKAVFIDLDGTLGYYEHGDLAEVVGKMYANWLSKEFGVDYQQTLSVLLNAVKIVKTKPSLDKSVAQQILENLSWELRIPIEDLDNATDIFYKQKFVQIRENYKARKGAKEVIEYLFEKGYKVVIATDPIIKRFGVLKRLEWIGLLEYPYCFVTSAEVCRAAKPHQIYYLDLLEVCKVKPHEAVMIGDKLENDIIPAKRLGLYTIHLGREMKENKAADHVIEEIEDIINIL